jgi:hypothetical protein
MILAMWPCVSNAAGKLHLAMIEKNRKTCPIPEKNVNICQLYPVPGVVAYNLKYFSRKSPQLLGVIRAVYNLHFTSSYTSANRST